MAVTVTAVPKNKQQSVIWFLTLENVFGVEIYVRICMVYGVQIVITKSTVTDRYRDSRQDDRVRMTNLEVVDLCKERPSVVCRRYQETHRLIRKMPR